MFGVGKIVVKTGGIEVVSRMTVTFCLMITVASVASVVSVAVTVAFCPMGTAVPMTPVPVTPFARFASVVGALFARTFLAVALAICTGMGLTFYIRVLTMLAGVPFAFRSMSLLMTFTVTLTVLAGRWKPETKGRGQQRGDQ